MFGLMAHSRSASCAVRIRMRGIVDVLTGVDTQGVTMMFLQRSVSELLQPRCTPLAVDEVRYVGEPVAAVLATTPGLAADACDLIQVEYEPLPGVADAEAALKPDAPLVHAELETNVAYTTSFGAEEHTVEAALRGADHLFTLRLRSPRIAAVPLEPRVFQAGYVPATGAMTVYASTQSPFALRARIAGLLSIPLETVRVLARDVGGGFGVKTMLYREDVVALLLARKHGSAVRWTATRSEDLVATQQARDQAHVIEAGFDSAGTLQVIRARIVCGLGAYLSQSAVVSGWRSGRLICGPYAVAIARGEVTGVLTNTPPTGVYRGAGRPEATLSIEQIMDTAARALQLDPAEIRLRNFIRPEQLPWTTPTGVTYDSGNYGETLQTALELAAYRRLRTRAEHARATGALVGIGLCAFIDPSGGAGGEGGRVRVEGNGQVQVFSGSFPQGQGHATTFAQIAAERLKVPVHQVEVIQGDTDRVPFGVGTFAARSTPLGGSAVHVAAEQVVEQLREAAAQLLEIPPNDVTHAFERFHPVGVPGRSVSFAQAAAAVPGGVEATVHFDDAREPHAHGCHICAVRIDPETGKVHIESYVAVDDAGVVINPMIVDGQLHGGLAQGIGQALTEQVVFGADGMLLSGTLADYSLRRASEVPAFELGRTHSPTPFNPIGAKGIGESGAVAAPSAIASAVMDALSGRGAFDVELPFTCETVWQLLARSGVTSRTNFVRRTPQRLRLSE